MFLRIFIKFLNKISHSFSTLSNTISNGWISHIVSSYLKTRKDRKYIFDLVHFISVSTKKKKLKLENKKKIEFKLKNLHIILRNCFVNSSYFKNTRKRSSRLKKSSSMVFISLSYKLIIAE